MKPGQWGNRCKKALAALGLVVLLMWVGYAVAISLPAGSVQAFTQWAGRYRLELFLWRLCLLSVVYGVIWWQVGRLLLSEKVSPRQRQYLITLRRQALAAIVLLELVFGQNLPGLLFSGLAGGGQ